MKRTLKRHSDIILETIDSIVILMNLDGIVVAMNKAAEKITGYDAEEIVNKKHWSIFIPKDEQGKVDEIFHALIHGRKVSTSINHWVSKTNELIDIKWNNSFIRDENDEIQFVVATGTNLSTYKLDIEEQRLSSLVFETTDPCVITDKDNCILRVNKAFTDVTGYSKDEVIHKNPNLLSSGLHDKTFYRLMWESIEETGSWFGEVINRKKDGSLFTEYLKINAVYDDYGSITHYVSTFLDISQAKENEEKLSFLSEYDAQTGLLNRNHYLETLANDVENLGSSRAVLLYFRLKNLSTLNTFYGVKYTDTVLLKFLHDIQQIISTQTSKYTLARISGADFALHFIEVPDECFNKTNCLEGKIERIVKQIVSLSNNFIAEEHHRTHNLMAHFGVMVLPDDTPNNESWLRHASAACQEAESNDQEYVYFSNKLQESFNYRHHIETSLVKAIGNGFKGFELYHQPQFDNEKQLTGGEILIRWNLDGSMVPPDHFIPIAEKSKAIIEINRWVIDEAINQLIELRNKALITKYHDISINLSATCLADLELVPYIKTKIDQFPFITKHMTMEITETAFVHDIKLVKKQLSALRNFGFRISIDDFGTGYSSLSYLSEFVFDELKIDKSFIDDIGIKTNKAHRLVKSIIGIARALEVDVIAEGIETEEQLNTLIDMDCCNFQGYYLKKPMPFSELIQLLEKSNQAEC